jgi:glutamate dehydrogenase
VVRAYRIARAITDAGEHWAVVAGLVGTLPAEVQRELLAGIDRLVESTTRWHLDNPTAEPLHRVIEPAQAAFRELARSIDELGPPAWLAAREEAIAAWVERGVPAAAARRHVATDDLVRAPDIIDLAHRSGHSLAYVAQLFLAVGPAFELDWLEQQLSRIPAATRWHRGAIQAVADDLAVLRRELAEQVIAEAGEKSPDAALEAYVAARGPALVRLTRMLRTLAVDGVDDVAGLVVAIRQIRSLGG